MVPNMHATKLYQGWFQGLPIMGPPYGKLDPYYSHIFRDSYGSGMGIVWGPRGPMSLGLPENPTNPSRYVIFLPKLLRFFWVKRHNILHTKGRSRYIQVFKNMPFRNMTHKTLHTRYSTCLEKNTKSKPTRRWWFVWKKLKPETDPPFLG